MKISINRGKQNKIHVLCDDEYMFTVDAEYWFSSPYHGINNIEDEEEKNICMKKLIKLYRKFNFSLFVK